MKWKLLLAIAMVATVFSSCKSGDKKSSGSSNGPVTSKELDRDDAKQVILNTLALPKDLIRSMAAGDLYVHDGWPNKYSGEYSLVSSGYRNIISTERCNYSTNVNILFTEKASPFIVSQKVIQHTKFTGERLCNSENEVYAVSVKLGSIISIEINSLRKVTDTEYEVEFTFSTQLNDIGQEFNKGVLNTKVLGIEYYLKPQKATLLKYDDGWKASSNGLEIFNKYLVSP